MKSATALVTLLLSAALLLPAPPALADTRAGPDAQRWVASWGMAPAGPPPARELPTFDGRTLRLIVHTSIGGKRVRVRLSNRFGAAPLRVGAARVALRQRGAAIVAASGRVLTFGGRKEIVIAPGAQVLSEPVDLALAPLSDLAVSLYLPGPAPGSTLHGNAYQTSYVSEAGDFSASAMLPVARTLASWPFVTDVEVLAPAPAAAIVAFGDSITDGAVTTIDTNRRWPDRLAWRLQQAARVGAQGAPGARGVVNRGIGGNRLLRDPGRVPLSGRAALARFDGDVLATAGVGYVIVLLGINDIGQPGSDSASLAEAVGAHQVIDAYRQLIARARAKGLTIVGATLTPFEGTIYKGYYTPEKEAVRSAINEWIRNNVKNNGRNSGKNSGKNAGPGSGQDSGQFDAVIDFDRALRDPARPTRMLPAYDSGDHLHPNDQGMQAMADAIDLNIFAERHAAPRGSAMAK